MIEPFTLLLLALAGAAVATIACLTWDAVARWIDANRTADAEGWVELLHEALENGTHKVVAGVFDAGGAMTATTTWHARTLDAQTQGRVVARGRVRV